MNSSNIHSPLQNPKKLAEEIESASREVYRHIPERVLQLAEEVSVFDLLNSDVCRCETLSLLQNINRYKRFFPEQPKEEQNLLTDIQEIGDLMPRIVYSTAFSMLSRLKEETNKGRAQYPSHINRTFVRKVPSKLATKPKAAPLTDNQTRQLLDAWVKVQLKDDKTSFTRAEVCDWVEKVYLKENSQAWHDSDLAIKGQEPTWKTSISRVPQKLQEEEIIVYRKRKELWVIYED